MNARFFSFMIGFCEILQPLISGIFMIMIGDKEACLIKSRFLLLSPEINLLVIELRREGKKSVGKKFTLQLHLY